MRATKLENSYGGLIMLLDELGNFFQIIEFLVEHKKGFDTFERVTKLFQSKVFLKQLKVVC